MGGRWLLETGSSSFSARSGLAFRPRLFFFFTLLRRRKGEVRGEWSVAGRRVEGWIGRRVGRVTFLHRQRPLTEAQGCLFR